MVSGLSSCAPWTSARCAAQEMLHKTHARTYTHTHMVCRGKGGGKDARNDLEGYVSELRH